jgi:nucleotide-binding universal stress UspA family protein
MPKKILVPIDFTDTSIAALRKAAEFSTKLGAELLLLHVEEFPVTSYGELPYLPPYLGEEHAEEAKRKMGDVLTMAKVRSLRCAAPHDARRRTRPSWAHV